MHYPASITVYTEYVGGLSFLLDHTFVKALSIPSIRYANNRVVHVLVDCRALIGDIGQNRKPNKTDS